METATVLVYTLGSDLLALAAYEGTCVLIGIGMDTLLRLICT